MIHRVSWSRLSIGPPIPASDGFVSLMDADLRILVGVTGVGKTTTLEGLADRLDFCVLPDRRSLADTVTLPAAQALEGQAPAAVPDRVERFRLTAVYREHHPGGAAEALASLWVQREPEEMLFFDGLRGEDECRWAATHLPRASFVVLDAPAALRLQRLVGRQSDFDRAGASASALPAGTSAAATDSLFAQVPGLEGLMSAQQAATVLAAAEAAGSTRQDVAEKAAILVAESRNYDPAAAISVLAEALPDERLLIVDTGRQTPAAIADRIAAWAQGVCAAES